MAESFTRTLETILVTGDADLVLTVLSAVFQTAKFVVVLADRAATALRVAATYTGEIDLLISDVEISGPNLAKALKQVRPAMHALFIGKDPLAIKLGWPCIQKPFTSVQLLERINCVLHPAEISHFARTFSAGSSE
jgi:DNA-binding response OmpR family regulator